MLAHRSLPPALLAHCTERPQLSPTSTAEDSCELRGSQKDAGPCGIRALKALACRVATWLFNTDKARKRYKGLRESGSAVGAQCGWFFLASS